ncbi:MAG: PepSY domain-containing protein [Actinomycetota bacterium]|nr:PepSY domain-containing protein [Actinomycetota bacterium]
MNNRSKFLAVGATTLAVAAGGTGLAIAGSGNDDTGDSEAPITGSALDQAKAAALDHLGEGTVTETEVGDEESLYEVEVTLDDGSETDVQLDRGFNVVGSESDAGESEATGD